MRLVWTNDDSTTMVEAFVEPAYNVHARATTAPDKLFVATRPSADAVWGPPERLTLEGEA